MSDGEPAMDPLDVTTMLLSGGVASAAVAAWRRPDRCLFVDYGQAPAISARSASLAIASYLGLRWAELAFDATALDRSGRSAERWPYRNQLLLTLAAAWAQPRDERLILVGSVREEDDFRPDASHLFFRRIDQLLRVQSGGLRLGVPALGMSLAELVRVSGIGPELLDLTYACEVADEPCGRCRGCRTREALLARNAGGGIVVSPRQR
jgi:7-cyano-7-deazaguanine synthase